MTGADWQKQMMADAKAAIEGEALLPIPAPPFIQIATGTKGSHSFIVALDKNGRVWMNEVVMNTSSKWFQMTNEVGDE